MDTKLQVLISTVGFGVGASVPDVEDVIHWEVSGNTVFYWQGTGQTGHDGCPAMVILYAAAFPTKTSADICDIISKENSSVYEAASWGHSSRWFDSIGLSSPTLPPTIFTCKLKDADAVQIVTRYVFYIFYKKNPPN